MSQLVMYCLIPISYCVDSAGGFLAKTNKANSFIIAVPEPTVNELTRYQCTVLQTILNRSQKNCIAILSKWMSTDMYSTTPVKALERKLRESLGKLIVKGLKIEKLKNWKSFLCNNGNKQHLILLMHTGKLV